MSVRRFSSGGRAAAAAAVVALTTVLLGCSVAQPVSTTQEVLFVTSAQGGQGMVSSYLVDASTGALAEAPWSPVSTGGTVGPTAVSLALVRGGRFLYAANPASGDPAVAGFYVDALTGASHPLPLFSTAPFNNPNLVAAGPGGDILLVDSTLSGNLASFRVDPVAGTLAALASVIVSATNPMSTVAVDPAGSYVYTTISSSVIGGWLLDPATGIAANPSFTGVTSGGSAPVSAVIDRQGRMYYITDGTGRIEGYSIAASTGALTLLFQSSSLPQGGPSRVVIDPTGRYLYSVDVSGGTVSAYSINYATGALSPAGSPVTIPGTQTGPVQPVVDASGAFLYASQGAGGSDFYCFSLDTSTGAVVAGSAVKTTIPGATSIAAMIAGTVTVPAH